MCFFFFQAEDGIRDLTVTGVQTCALPIWNYSRCFGGAAARCRDGIDRNAGGAEFPHAIDLVEPEPKAAARLKRTAPVVVLSLEKADRGPKVLPVSRGGCVPGHKQSDHEGKA